MRTLLILITTLIFSFTSYSQIEVHITKISKDSAIVEFPKEMKLEIDKSYDFIFKTNYTLSDSIKESFTSKYLYDGLIVRKEIVHYELGFHLSTRHLITEKNTFDFAKSTIYINRTNKWIVSIDGKNISRYNSNDISATSTIDIEIQSDLVDISKAKFLDEIKLCWLRNQSINRLFNFDGTKLHIDLKDYGQFLEGDDKKERYSHIMIVLPQVRVKSRFLFSDNPQERMYIMRYIRQ